MYNVNKGPSKLVTQTRRGIPSHLERLDPLRDSVKKLKENDDADVEEIIGAQKPVFLQINGNKFHNSKPHQESMSPSNKKMIKYISDSWRSKICSDYDNKSGHNKCCDNHSYFYYQGDEVNECLKDFVPFDLENWWGKHLYETITESVE